MSEVEVVDLLKGYEPKNTPYDSIISLAQRLLESSDVDSFYERNELLNTVLRKKENYISDYKKSSMLKSMIESLSVEFPMVGASLGNFSYQAPVFKENNA